MGSKPVNLSASRAAAFLGVSPYKTPVQAWLEIMEEKHPGFCDSHNYVAPKNVDPWELPLNPKTASLRWGLAFEDAICEHVGIFADREREYTAADKGLPFVTCHIDGRDDNGILNENKTAFDMAYRQAWGEDGSDQIPKQYQIQVQHQMMCTGDKEVFVNCLVFPKAPAEWEEMGYKIKVEAAGFEYICNKDKSVIASPSEFLESLNLLGYFHRYHILVNEGAQKAMAERYAYIWNEHIEKELPPPAQGDQDIKWMFASPEGEIEADEKIKELWQEYNDCDNETKSLDNRMKEIKDTFANYVIKMQNSGTVKKSADHKLNVMAGSRKLFSVSRPEPGISVSRPAVNRIKDDHPELYEEMKKTSLADIIKVSFTDKQTDEIIALEKQEEKLLGKKKLSSLLAKENVIYAIAQNAPELFNALKSCRMVEDTESSARLTISKLKEE